MTSVAHRSGLGPGSGDADGFGADGQADLDRGVGDARRCGGTKRPLPGHDVDEVNEPTVGRHVTCPHRSRLCGLQLGGTGHYKSRGNGHGFAISAVAVDFHHRKRRHSITDGKTCDSVADCRHSPRGFVSDPRRELRLDWVPSLAEEGVRPVQRERLHGDGDFAFGRVRHGDRFDLQDRGTSVFAEQNGLRFHDPLPSPA